jgi:transmembrane sensor
MNERIPFEELEGVIRAELEAERDSWDTDAAWRRFQHQRAHKHRRKIFAVAAVAILGFGIGIIAKLNTAAAAIYESAAGERREVRLSDGTRVQLAAASKLIVPASYAASSRSVKLEGEAFFEVTHDQDHPFVVQARHTKTRVLGTTFDIKAYDEQIVEVVLVSGKVEVTNKVAHTVLEPGFIARSTRNGVSVTTISTADYTDWTRDKLSFQNASLKDAARRIADWYGVDIVIDDAALADTRITAILELQKIDAVMAVLAATVGAKWQRNGQSIRIY